VTERGPRIRGHHLICLQYFHGEGYSPEFARNLFSIIDRLARGEKGTVVVGVDDVCAACPALAKGQCAQEPESEEAIRTLDALALELLELEPGQEFEWGVATLSVQRFIERWRVLACAGCEWEEECRPLIDLTAGYTQMK
jgi:uncharacterized protein